MKPSRDTAIQVFKCFMIEYLTVAFYKLFASTPKKKRELTELQRRGTGIPKNRSTQAHAMTKHSISIAQKPLFFEKCQFSTLRHLRTNMLYIKAKSQVTVQSPLFSYVTFAKLAKSLKTSAYKTKKSRLISRQNRIESH